MKETARDAEPAFLASVLCPVFVSTLHPRKPSFATGSLAGFLSSFYITLLILPTPEGTVYPWEPHRVIHPGTQNSLAALPSGVHAGVGTHPGSYPVCRSSAGLWTGGRRTSLQESSLANRDPFSSEKHH